jgi:hypothetical protein
MIRGGWYQKEGKQPICMPPYQGKTILENQELPRFFKDEDDMDDCRSGLKKRKRAKDQVNQRIHLQPTATGIADLPKNCLFHWLESPLRTVWQDTLIRCLTLILLKLHDKDINLDPQKYVCGYHYEK